MEDNERYLEIEIPQLDRSVSESFKAIRTSLLYTGESKIIAVSSSVPDEGKTVIATQLALHFSMLDKKVLLVDCDLRKPKLKSILGIKNSVTGVSECLSGQASLNIYPTNVDNLYLFLSGKTPPNSAELLSNGRMKRLLEALRDKFDYIILDTPPAAGAVDIQIIGTMVDGVILIIRNEFVRLSVVRNIVKQFERNNIRIIGTILNGVKNNDKDYYYYHYEY